MNETKVSVPPHAAPKNPTTQGPVEPGAHGKVDGFGSGSAHSTAVNGGRDVTEGSMGKSSIQGFSGGGVKPGKA